MSLKSQQHISSASHMSATCQSHASHLSARFHPYISHMSAKFRPNVSRLSATQLQHTNQMPVTCHPHVSHMSATCHQHVSHTSDMIEIFKILVNSNISIIIASQERNFVLVLLLPNLCLTGSGLDRYGKFRTFPPIFPPVFPKCLVNS